MNISKGDLFKALELTLTFGGAPFALTGSDVLSLAWVTPVTQTRVVVVPTVVSLTAGTIQHAFTAGQTEEIGMYEGQVTVTRLGKPLSFPDDGTFFRWIVNPKK